MNVRDQELLDEMEQSGNELFLPLRAKEGFDEQAYVRFCNTIRRCTEAWRCRDYLPKVVVAFFLGTNPWLVGCEDLYPESTKQKILDAEMELADLMLECASSRGSEDGPVR
jgi:hypothetical protein